MHAIIFEEGQSLVVGVLLVVEQILQEFPETLAEGSRRRNLEVVLEGSQFMFACV